MSEVGNSTLDRVIAVVADELMLDPASIGPETDFVEILERNSLATMEVTVRIEAEFGVRTPDEAAGALRTVQDLVDFLENPAKLFLLRPAARDDGNLVMPRDRPPASR